jgi:Protein kinase domain
MGHVWLACDEQTGLDVALKIVAREGKAAARAEREARAAAALRHPRCQRIYALARDPDHVYISYEYIPGKTLRQALTAGELDDRGAVEVATQVLEALAHAHGRGIVHRDVKPSNILLAEGDAVDARLLDFGLAQMAEFDSLTAMGDVPGTLGYISPERLLGKPSTFSADVWAVGVILWEMLGGSHPFREAGVKETSRRIQSGAPPLQDVRPDLPAPLCKAIASALAVNPAQRPKAGQLADELRPLGKKRRPSKVAKPAAESRPKVRLSHWVTNRALPGGACALATGWVATSLPFYPAQWPLALAAIAAAVGFMAPRAGLAFALAATFFPLANISLGLGILFAAIAAGWLVLAWNDARAGLLALAGPLLAPVAGLGLVPLAAQLSRGRLRRALQAGAAVLLAALVAGLRHERLPFDGSLPPLGLGIAGSNSPGAVAYALWQALLAHPAVLGETAAFAAAAALLPGIRGRGPWHAALFGAAFLAAIAVLAPAAPLLPLVGAAWVTAAALALQPGL